VAVVNEIAVIDDLLFEHDLKGEVFLIPAVHPDTCFGPHRVPISTLCGRVVWGAARHPIADVRLKIIVFRGGVADIGGRNDVYERVIRDFHKVAEPHHWLHRLLCHSGRHYCQEKNAYYCYLGQWLHGFSLRSPAAACPCPASAPGAARYSALKAMRNGR
jgi:hypothetical protein